MTNNIVKQVADWSKSRLAASFWIPCATEGYAREVQTALKVCGFLGYVTFFGKEISVVLYLNDN